MGRGHGVERTPGEGSRGGASFFWFLVLAISIGLGLTRLFPFSLSFAQGENTPAASPSQPAKAAKTAAQASAQEKTAPQPSAAAVTAPSAPVSAKMPAVQAQPLEVQTDQDSPAVKSYIEILRLYKNLQQDQDNILSQLRIAYNERDKAKGDAEILKDQAKHASEDKSEIQKENAELKKTLQPMNAKIALLEEKAAKLQVKADADQEKISQLTRSLQGSETLTLRQELKDKEAEFAQEKARLETMIETANRDREMVQNKHIQKERKIHDLEIELSSVSANYEKALDENRQLHSRFDTIDTQLLKISGAKEKAVNETAAMHYNLGVFYAGQKNYERALEEFKKAVEWRPNDALSYYNLGLIYAEHLPDPEKAKENFQKYLDLVPEAQDRNFVEGMLKSITYALGRPGGK